VERGSNRRSPPPVRRTTLLYLGVMTGVLALRRYGIWRPLHCGLPGQPISALAAAPDHPEIVFAASDGVIYHSADGGTRWRQAGRVPRGARVWALLAGPRPASRLRAGREPVGIVYSDNGGTSWKPAALPPLPAGAVTRLLPPSGEGGRFYALAAGTLLTSADGGATWQALETLPAPIADIAQHPDAPGTLYAAGPAGLFRTRNAGRTWQRLLSQPVSAVLVHPNRPRTLVAALPTGLHQSPNAGVQWQPMAGGEAVPDDPVVDLVGSAAGEVVLAVTARGRLLQLVDGRWEPPLMGPTPPVLTAIAPSGELSSWPGAPKRAQPRRRRPAKREAGAPETAGGAKAPPRAGPSPAPAPPA
jgi:photosystem II stability/assembly factor-like uncharacterized protein